MVLACMNSPPLLARSWPPLLVAARYFLLLDGDVDLLALMVSHRFCYFGRTGWRGWRRMVAKTRTCHGKTWT